MYRARKPSEVNKAYVKDYLKIKIEHWRQNRNYFTTLFPLGRNSKQMYPYFYFKWEKPFLAYFWRKWWELQFFKEMTVKAVKRLNEEIRNRANIYGSPEGSSTIFIFLMFVLIFVFILVFCFFNFCFRFCFLSFNFCFRFCCVNFCVCSCFYFLLPFLGFGRLCPKKKHIMLLAVLICFRNCAKIMLLSENYALCHRNYAT